MEGVAEGSRKGLEVFELGEQKGLAELGFLTFFVPRTLCKPEV